ncbi:hypothetical protein OG216_34730 [Streptomycetaceae bacterium NBC_01309]
MDVNAWIAAFSAAVAVGALTMAWTAVRAANAQTAFELARGLQDKLISPDIAATRDRLEAYRLGPRPTPDATRAVVHDYFVMLWAFEHANVGRESLVRRRRVNRTGPAVRFLDTSIRWHLEHWATVWPRLRSRVVDTLGEPLDDHQSIPGLLDLTDAVLGPTAAVRELRQQIEAEQAAHTPRPLLPRHTP